MACSVYVLAQSWKNCLLKFSQGLARLSYVGNDTLLSWEAGIGVTKVAHFASAFWGEMCAPEHLTLNFTLVLYFPVSTPRLIPEVSKNLVAREHLQFQYFAFESWMLCIK